MRYISLDESFAYLNAKKKNSWRVSIKSVLVNETDKTSYYLTKECIAERIGANPFRHKAKSELCVVLDSEGNTYKIRDIPFFKRNEFGEHYHQRNFKTSDELRLKEASFEEVEFSKVICDLKNRKLGNLYSKFSFNYRGKKYFIFAKVEYLNFAGKNNEDEDYLQPIFGYVPFLIDGNIHIGYVVKYIEENGGGNLEIRLRANKSLSSFFPQSNRLIIKILYKVVQVITSPIKVSWFNKVVTLTESGLTFYKLNS